MSRYIYTSIQAENRGKGKSSSQSGLHTPVSCFIFLVCPFPDLVRKRSTGVTREHPLDELLIVAYS